jgi:hypothetical protein
MPTTKLNPNSFSLAIDRTVDSGDLSPMQVCPHCQQPVPEYRLGVRLTPLKARIFDVIKRSGDHGISPDELFNICLRERDTRPSKLSLKAHINQINEATDDSNQKIVCVDGAYVLIRRL